MYIFKPVVNSGKHHRMIMSPTYILPPCHLPDSGTETNREQFEWRGHFSLFGSGKSTSFKNPSDFCIIYFPLCLSVSLEKT